MEFRKIASIRVDGPATGGTTTLYRLPARAGGRFVKQVNYQIKIIAASHPAAQVGLKLEHSPDGNVSILHSTPIGTASPSSMPGLLSGDSAATQMLGEYLHPILTCISGDASSCWLQVEVFEMRKPF